ncbi:MAG: MepB family protein [Culicoidibacterales bacterium]
MSITATIHGYAIRLGRQKPKKSGQFVTFWTRKTDDKTNFAYGCDNSPDFLIIFCLQDNQVGYFLFSWDTLFKHKIVSTATSPGKMGFRIYRLWDNLENKMTVETQKWQLGYWVSLGE